MTLKEANELVRSKAPPATHYVNVSKSDTWYGPEYPPHEEQYSISIQPGLNGDICEEWKGRTLEACIAQFEAHLRGSENNEE